MKFFRNKKIYLDYASFTPIDPAVGLKVGQTVRGYPYNPNAIYKGGVLSHQIMDEARASIARSISAHADEIIFTGSGTESDALAILGLVYGCGLEKPHIVTTNIEHHAVLENCKMLEKMGLAEVSYVKVEENGIINPKAIRDSIKENTILVSVMYANNEIGTVQPIREIAKEIRHYKKNKSFGNTSEKLALNPLSEGSDTHNFSDVFPALNNMPYFHTDAAQAMNYLETENIERLGVDMMSFNGSKIYGPKGVGVLYKKRGVKIAPIYSGGGQEFGLRSGTENVAGMIGIALALEITNKMKEKEVQRLTKIRDYAIEKLLALSKTSNYEIILNGDNNNRLPNNINISINGISSELLVIELDAKGIMVSERSACGSQDDEGSHVIKALRDDSDSLRITMGRQTRISDIDILVQSISSILKKYKEWN